MKITKKKEKDINNFKKQMIAILKAPRNESKSSWKEIDLDVLCMRLKEEIKELKDSLNKSICSVELADSAQHECCDAANFLFFIWDNLEDIKQELIAQQLKERINGKYGK